MSSDSHHFGNELSSVRDEHKKELVAVRQTAAKTLTDALMEQQKQLSLQFGFFIHFYNRLVAKKRHFLNSR